MKTDLPPVAGLLLQRPISAGRVFFVSSGGNNDNSGINPEEPFATITEALTNCLDARGDYILVMDNTTEPAYPVAVSLDSVHIIGLGPPVVHPKAALFGGGQRCMDLDADANYVELAGMGFGSSTTHALQMLGPYGAWIHHCSFGGSYLWDGAVQSETGIQTSQWPQGVIEDCLFGSGHFAYGLSGYGIRAGSGFVNDIIRRCLFQNCALGGIRADGGNIEMGWILDNKFFYGIANTPPVGWAINLTGVGADWGGMVNGNHATETGDHSATNNPYRDLSTGALITSRGWGQNYANDTQSDPAVA